MKIKYQIQSLYFGQIHDNLIKTKELCNARKRFFLKIMSKNNNNNNLFVVKAITKKIYYLLL